MEGGFTENRETYIAFWGKRASREFCKAFLNVLVLGKVPLGCFSPIPRFPLSSPLSSVLCLSPLLPLLPHRPPQAILHIALSACTQREPYTFHSLSRLIGSLRKAKTEARLILVTGLYNKQTNKKAYRPFVEKSVLSPPQNIMCFKTLVRVAFWTPGFCKGQENGVTESSLHPS